MTKKNFTKQHSFFADDVNSHKEEYIARQPRITRDAPEGYKPAYIEVKSKRVQLVLQPSIYERAKAKATEQDISFNEYIHRLIDADTQ